MSASRLPAHVFGVNILNGAIGDTVRCNRMSEIQDGGSITQVHVSQRIYAQDCNEIPTAIPMFSGRETWLNSSDLKMNGKSKMAAIDWK